MSNKFHLAQLRIVPVAALLVVAGGCSRDVVGELTIVRPRGVAFSSSYNQCAAGTSYGQFGVSLRNSDGLDEVVVLEEAAGNYRVVIRDPTHRDTIFGLEDRICSKYDVVVTRRGPGASGGHLKLDCAYEGLEVRGEVVFGNCH